jgi:hypothetical protein
VLGAMLEYPKEFHIRRSESRKIRS